MSKNKIKIVAFIEEPRENFRVERNYFPADDVDVVNDVTKRVHVVFPRNYAGAPRGAIDGDCARSFDATGDPLTIPRVCAHRRNPL